MSTVDYVITHELAHLKHLDHSQAFWDTLEMLYPEYEKQKECLRLNGRKLNI
ncbi:YgjP-like metallopeptidase domain-containing protein [Sporosarcina cascadiensis]|uniref:YgjP-like metallopeptidase domain-containing protein n=1 Tax=Sporosarcina cascadiensis TaxID=2660747 RepID=UPI00129B7484|nr:M48 family metallopeptidase [Sporosarcina cascadiensis]